MAVYCGVCARRLSSAADNGGPFRVSRDFLPLDDEGLRLSGRIDDTCEDCASVLAAAAAVAAAEIRSKPDNARRADEVGRMLRSERERRQAYRKAQDEALSEVARRFRR